jgi:hypothetical protein
MTVGGSAPKPPKPVPEPDLEAANAAEREKRRLRLMRGRASTVLAPQGATSQPAANVGSAALTGGTR